MSLRDVLGLYGPNKPVWSLEAKQQILDSRVKWVVWRLDADPSAPSWLDAAGIRVIAQDSDGFNGDPYLDPVAEAAQVFALLEERCPPGTLMVPDNEPNLHPKTATAWHAEQWTRYLRAYMAYWRYLDPGGHYPLITPALAVGPDRNGALWHQTQLENLVEADGRGLHAYWQFTEQIRDPDFGAPWELLRNEEIPPSLYVLEYGNTWPQFTHADTLSQYETFLLGLPTTVKCAALFGVDLTDDWIRFRITRDVIEWLARLE
jgi:hypothetical protein